jgi:hypothetical protein
MIALPPVASNFYTDCKKCAQERYHKVLTHIDTKNAKLECEVCHAKKNFKLSEVKSVAKKAGAKKPPSANKAAKAAEAAANAASAKFLELQGKNGEQKAQPYRMANVFTVDAKIEHPKFGVGFVVMSLPDKIEVVFQDSSRQLVQGRK